MGHVKVTDDMNAVEQAFIIPSVFLWAIERARSTPEKLAKKLHVPSASILSWGRGKAHPSFGQAQKVADALYIPFGYLFLAEPPDERVPVADFRVVPGARISPSAELIDVINDVLVKQEWYREFLTQHSAQPLPFVGRFSSRRYEANNIAQDICQTIGLDNILRQSCESWSEFYVTFVRRIEAAGVLVMRAGVAAGNNHRKLSIKEFRGFALTDPFAPVVFVNSRDWPKAQLFTIAHELAHIWIGKSGVSNENLKRIDSANPIERICNEIAAEVLIPSIEAVALWRDGEGIGVNINRLASHFRVSSIVALRRALDLGKLSREEYFRLYAVEEKAFKERVIERRGGGNFYNMVLARNSSTLTRAAVQAATKGTVLYRDASRLLNVNAPAIQKIARHLKESVS